MEKETFLSGYCRCLAESRMVAVVTEDGALTDVDCNYETCPHTPSCTIAQSISQLLKEYDGPGL